MTTKTQNKVKHTPMPWNIDAVETCLRYGKKAQLGKYYDIDDDILVEADAQFIIKACNNYEQLLEACQIAYHHLKTIEPDSYETVKLEQAIAKVESEK